MAAPTSPTSLLMGHQLRREHAYLLQRMEKLEAASKQPDAELVDRMGKVEEDVANALAKNDARELAVAELKLLNERMASEDESRALDRENEIMRRVVEVQMAQTRALQTVLQDGDKMKADTAAVEEYRRQVDVFAEEVKIYIDGLKRLEERVVGLEDGMVEARRVDNERACQLSRIACLIGDTRGHSARDDPRVIEQRYSGGPPALKTTGAGLPALAECESNGTTMARSAVQSPLTPAMKTTSAQEASTDATEVPGMTEKIQVGMTPSPTAERALRMKTGPTQSKWTINSGRRSAVVGMTLASQKLVAKPEEQKGQAGDGRKRMSIPAKAPANAENNIAPSFQQRKAHVGSSGRLEKQDQNRPRAKKRKIVAVLDEEAESRLAQRPTRSYLNRHPSAVVDGKEDPDQVLRRRGQATQYAGTTSLKGPPVAETSSLKAPEYTETISPEAPQYTKTSSLKVPRRIAAVLGPARQALARRKQEAARESSELSELSSVPEVDDDEGEKLATIGKAETPPAPPGRRRTIKQVDSTAQFLEKCKKYFA